jgi:hypothetical protein
MSETIKIGKTEYYKGFSISKKANSNTWVARKDRKIRVTENSKSGLLKQIDAVIKNRQDLKMRPL